MYSIKQNLASPNIERNVWEETGIVSVWNLSVSYNQSEDTSELLLISADFNPLTETIPCFLFSFQFSEWKQAETMQLLKHESVYIN